MMKNEKQTVLALHPNTNGVAYALFNNPDELVEYGVGSVRPINNTVSIKKIRKYLEYFKPSIVLVRGIEDRKHKSKRIEKLISSICIEAEKQNLEVHLFTRSQIKETFVQFNVFSKYQISKKIIEWFPPLVAFAYPKRKRWMTENHNAGLFDAISLAVVFWDGN